MAKKPKIAETDLYQPVKTLLEGQGYEVKGEVAAADIVAIRGDEDPIIVELKTAFSLTLFHQAIERQSLSDHVYIAVPRGTNKAYLKSLKRNKTLCRRLGLGLMTVRLKDGFVETHLDPEPYKPRPSKVKKGRLLREFSRRVGDPNKGGTARTTIMTAYRQDALRCLGCLEQNGPTKAAEVAKITAVETARRIMADDHYGWFERVDRSVYALTPKGKEAVIVYASNLVELVSTPEQEPAA